MSMKTHALPVLCAALFFACKTPNPIPSVLVQVDAAATDLSDCFTDQPDFRPYSALPADPRVLDPQKLLKPFDAKFDWKSLLESPKLDDADDFIQENRSRN